MVLTEEDIKIIKHLISYKNSREFLGQKLTIPPIKEENIFVADERQTMSNVFELVKYTHDCLDSAYKCDLLCRLSKGMFDAGMITAGECLTNYRMYNPYSWWGWMR